MRAGLLMKALVSALILPFTLSACASLEGAQRRIIATSTNAVLLPPMDVALHNFAAEDTDKLRHGLSRKQYREEVLTVYLAAIDANYSDFRSRVSSERRELGLGLDLVVLGFTNYASVARSSIVNSLSAAAAGFAGARGALDRNVYFDRTLPGLLASMDSQRLRIAARIAQNRQREADDYTLAMAFADLSAYEMAGSLDRAIEEVTAQAVEERQEAQRLYDSAVHSCITTENLVPNMTRIGTWVGAPARTVADLRAFAGLMNLSNLDTATTTDELGSRIEDGLAANYCTNSSLDTLITNAKAQPWGSGI